MSVSPDHTMLEAVCGCFMPCNIFLAGNSEVSLELQCFTVELITYIVCECDAQEYYTQRSVCVRDATKCINPRRESIILQFLMVALGTDWRIVLTPFGAVSLLAFHEGVLKYSALLFSVDVPTYF